MSRYDEVLAFMLENGVQMNKDQLAELKSVCESFSPKCYDIKSGVKGLLKDGTWREFPTEDEYYEFIKEEKEDKTEEKK